VIFAYGIGGQDPNILPENLGIRHNIQNLFLPGKKSIPDPILILRSQFPPSMYIEGGDFRVLLKKQSVNNHVAKVTYHQGSKTYLNELS
jgi:hypothetical protein